MRRRVYWLMPDVASARRVMNALQLAHIARSHLHFVAQEGTDLGDLHEASVLQSSNVVGAAQRGLFVGAVIGAVTGALIALSSIFDEPSKPTVVGALTTAGALFGMWVASLIGASTPSQRLARFNAAIKRGEVLLIADLPAHRVGENEALIQTSHPDAHLEGEEQHVLAFH